MIRRTQSRQHVTGSHTVCSHFECCRSQRPGVKERLKRPKNQGWKPFQMREATGTHMGESYQLIWCPAQRPQAAAGLSQSLEHMLYCPQLDHNLRHELGPIHSC